jgi:prepilin-type N-terminal cleavage/methylation domain-containing protein/prepilin-type processing-associated H-X9-DG protein
MNPISNQRRAFTLVELLVVIGIIAILVAFLLPSLQKARERANRVACMSNLRQTFLGMLMYAQTYKEYPTLLTWDYVVASGGSGDPISGEGYAAGHVVLPQLLVGLKYTSAKAAQCTTYNIAQWPWEYDCHTAAPWFRYNGPSANGWWVWNFSEGPNFLHYGWNYTGSSPTDASRGVSYRTRDHPLAGYNWYEYRAFLCCPRMIQIDGAWTITIAYESHGNSPQSATTGWGVQSDNASTTVRDRNYCFTDGHVEYIHTP